MTSNVRLENDPLVHAVKRAGYTACGASFGPGRRPDDKAWLVKGEDAGDAEIDCMACVAGIDLRQPIRFTVLMDVPVTVIEGFFLLEDK